MFRKIVLFAGLSIMAIVGVFLLWPIQKPIFNTPYSTILLDSKGQLMAGRIASDGQWRFPAGDSIPENFKIALLYFEDEYFFSHPGINPVSLARAAKQNFEAGRIVSGGSTITMQVARMLNNGNERNIINKLYEMLLSIRLELYLSKKEILSLYAAHAPFGGNVVGIEAASWRYYGRQSQQLSWAEAATLAVLPNSPALIYPGKKQDILKAKRDRLLIKLERKGILNKGELNLALAEPLPQKPNPLPDLASHLLSRLISEGKEGQRIRATLDAVLQNKVKKKINKHYHELQQNEIHNAAAIVTDVKTGAVVAYIGNTEAPLIHSPYVDIINAPRSTGSILKPILYAAAIDKGLITPNQLLPDIPTFFQGFTPKNFDNSYQGAVAAHEALTKSLNIPFVYLLKDYTYEQFHKDLQDLGFSTINNVSAHYGLSLILGGAEANLWDLASVYGSLVRTLNNYYTVGANNGYQKEAVHQVFTSADESIVKQTNFLSAGAIWWMFKSMQELQRPEEMSGWYNFAASRKIAWKTGTSYGFRDAWAVGTDGNFVVAVWTGNADGEGRSGLTGIRSSAPIMFDIFDLLPGSGDFLKTPPAEMDYFPVCEQSGYKAGINCNDIKEMPLPERSSYLSVCPYHSLIHLDEKKKFQVNADCYGADKINTVSWFQLPPVQAWYYKRYNANYEKVPSFKTDCPGTSVNDVMEMIYPRHSTKIYIPVEIDGKPGNCILEAAHVDPNATIFWHLDDEYLKSTTRTHQLSINPSFGTHQLRLVDNYGNEIELTIKVLNRLKT